MTQMLRSLSSLLLLAGLALAGLVPVSYAGPPLPEIPEANARFSDTQGCVEPTEVMRKNHMEFILHKRDLTMREGVRSKQHSLQQCIECHVPPQESGQVVRHSDEQHFCNSCHSYAAVSIDCFSCHRDTPMPKDASAPAFHPLGKAIDAHHGISSVNSEVDSEALETLVEMN